MGGCCSSKPQAQAATSAKPGCECKGSNKNCANCQKQAGCECKGKDKNCPHCQKQGGSGCECKGKDKNCPHCQKQATAGAKGKLDIAKLHYFGIYFRGESIRILLNHAKVQYEDVRIDMKQWPQLKSTMPGGQVPVLELKNGQKLNQTNSILRYLGKIYGYYPTEAKAMYEVDNLIDCYMDIFGNLAKPIFGPPEGKEKAITTALESVDSFLGKINPKCSKGGWLCGANISTADFTIGGLYANCFKNPMIYCKDKWDAILLKYPDFKNYGERFVAANCEYLNKRPPAPI